MSFEIANYRYNPFTGVSTPKGYGYGAVPKETHTIPASAPFWVYLNEIPQKDTPSTLFINEDGGGDFVEVSFTTVPAANQFRVVYPDDAPAGAVGQGIVEFHSSDAGKDIEVQYYGLGTMVSKEFYTKGIYDVSFNDVEIGNDATIENELNIDKINENTADAGVTIDGVLLKDNKIDARAMFHTNVHGTDITNTTLNTLLWTYIEIDEEIIVNGGGRTSADKNIIISKAKKVDPAFIPYTELYCFNITDNVAEIIEIFGAPVDTIYFKELSISF